LLSSMSNNPMKKLRYIFLAGIVLVHIDSNAVYSQSFQSVISSGTSQAAASGRTLSATLGQTIQGVSGASGKNIGSGFWYTITESAVSTDIETLDTNPQKFALLGNYPNPFNPETTFNFNLAKAGKASLVVYDMLGNKVETIVDQELPAGEFRTSWNASGMASGTYFYQLEANGNIATRKMTLMK